MTIDLTEVLASVCTTVSRHTGIETTLGRPADTVAGLCLFPVAYAPLHIMANQAGEEERSCRIRALLIPNTATDYDLVGKAADFLANNPVIAASKSPLFLIPEDMPLDILCQLFISAGIEYRLSLAFEIRFSMDTRKN